MADWSGYKWVTIHPHIPSNTLDSELHLVNCKAHQHVVLALPGFHRPFSLCSGKTSSALPGVRWTGSLSCSPASRLEAIAIRLEAIPLVVRPPMWRHFVYLERPEVRRPWVLSDVNSPSSGDSWHQIWLINTVSISVGMAVAMLPIRWALFLVTSSSCSMLFTSYLVFFQVFSSSPPIRSILLAVTMDDDCYWRPCSKLVITCDN